MIHEPITVSVLSVLHTQVCARDFVDYDANSLAVAAGVPISTAAANAGTAKMLSCLCSKRVMLGYVLCLVFGIAVTAALRSLPVLLLLLQFWPVWIVGNARCV